MQDKSSMAFRAVIVTILIVLTIALVEALCALPVERAA